MNKLLFAGAVILVTVALVGGFMVVGGPGQARLEKQDKERVSDLKRIHRYLECNQKVETPDPLPVALDDKTYCAGFYGSINSREDLTDPATGAPYVYRRISGRDFEICAQFATDIVGNDGRLGNAYFQRENGNIWCLSGDNGYRDGS